MSRRSVRGHAGVLREAAYDAGLEGPDQRSAPGRLRRTSTPACGWPAGCCSTCSSSGSRSAASSWIRSPRSTSPTWSAGARSAPARSRARSTASSGPDCRCRSASRTGPTATCRSPWTPSVPPPRPTPSPGSTSTAPGDPLHARQPRLPHHPARWQGGAELRRPSRSAGAGLLRAAGAARAADDRPQSRQQRQGPARQPAVAAALARADRRRSATPSPA